MLVSFFFFFFFFCYITHYWNAPWKKGYEKSRQCIIKQRHHFAGKSLNSQGYDFSSSRVWIWELDCKEGLAPRIDAFKLCCWRRLLRAPWTARRSNQSILKKKKKSTLYIHWKEWSWRWSSYTLATWSKELDHWKRLWYWERLKAGREGSNKEWDGWMASLTQWTWVWANFRRQWRTGKPGLLQSMWGHRTGHNSVTKQQL